MEPSSDNTLKVIIKQPEFERIISGEQKELSQEINEGNFKKYLDYDIQEGFLVVEDMLSDPEAELDLYMFNDGMYPFVPNNYDFIEISAGPVKERKSVIFPIEDISFEVAKDSKGREIRFNWSEDGQVEADVEGDNALWLIVYHLG